MTIPNFFIIGAAKSGTTSLYYYLKQHPQIYMSPVKEPHFFFVKDIKLNFHGPRDQKASQAYVTTIEEYCKLFDQVTNEIAIGEASNSYIYSSKVPKLIKSHASQAKLIAILRNPVDRAYSSFLYLTRDGREPLKDFARALTEEKARIQDNWFPIWHYKQRGFYYEQLKPYYELFEPQQLKVYLYEDFSDDPLDLLKDIYKFLGVDETFVPKISQRHNVSGIPKNKALHTFLRQPNLIKAAFKSFLPARLCQYINLSIRDLNLDKPKLAPEIRRELIEEYRQDILKLQDLIQRDLSKWLEPERLEK